MLPGRYLVAGAVVLVLVGAGVGIALAYRGGDDTPSLTAGEYLLEVSTICRTSSRDLDRIPAPANLTAYGDVVSSVRQALVVLRRRAAAMQAVEPPEGLRARVDRLFALNGNATRALRKTLAAAERRDAGAVLEGFGEFTSARDRSRAFAVALGVHC